MDFVDKGHNDIRIWFKQKYSYSSNDPRYLTATLEQMYFDFLTEVIVPDFLKRTDNNNPMVINMLKGRVKNKNYDKELSSNLKEQMDNLLMNLTEEQKKQIAEIQQNQKAGKNGRE